MSISDGDLPPGIIRSRPCSRAATPVVRTTPEPARREHSGEASPECDSGTEARSPLAKAKEDAYFFLSYRDRSEKEMTDRLLKRKHAPEVIDHVIEHLRAEGYMNDASFARRWVESRGATRGQRALAFELRQKGIDSEIAAEAFAERVDSDAEFGAAMLAATRRVGQPPIADRSPAAAKRLSAFLQRRGFSYATVRSVLRELYAPGAVEGDQAEELEE